MLRQDDKTDIGGAVRHSAVRMMLEMSYYGDKLPMPGLPVRFFAGVIGLIVMMLLFNTPVVAVDSRVQAPALVDFHHSLVERIWDVRAGKFIEPDEFEARLLAHEYLLLGETHDNHRHHAIQARIIERLHQAQREASVSFEMINDAQGEALHAVKINSVDELIEMLRAIEDRWPYARDYRQVFASVLHAGYEIRAANLRRDMLHQIVTEDMRILSDPIRHHLEQALFTDRQLRRIEADIITAHCDMLPDNAVQPMVQVQRVRDAVMSYSLLQSTKPVKVLIAGAGHVRNDLGVPVYLQSASKNARVLALGLLEVKPDMQAPDDYTTRWGGEHLPFDYVWFTPRAERTDPCVELRKRFQESRPNT